MTTHWNKCLDPQCDEIVAVQMVNVAFGCEIKLDPVSSEYCSNECTPIGSVWKRPTKCKTCKKILDDYDGKTCNNCWEVETRMYEYLQSDNGMQFVKDYAKCAESDPLWINSDKRGIK